MPNIKRYTFYNYSMDISFWISVAHLIRIAAVFAKAPTLPVPEWLFMTFGAITFLNMFFAAFLVIARPMRDEFAEQIWQFAAQKFVYLMIIAPLVVGFTLAGFEDEIRKNASSDWVGSYLLSELLQDPNPVWHFYGGVGHAIITFSLTAPSVFICIYKWCLWRTSR